MPIFLSLTSNTINMKKLLLLSLAITIFSCKKEPENNSITITSDYVKDIVYYLASDELEGRNTGTEGIDQSATYIEEKFNEYGLTPYFDTYRDNFEVNELDAFNVVGYLEGSDPQLKNEIILVGAHYDHIGRRGKPVENDSIGNGANDNASGTAAVMAMAKYFTARKNNKRSLMFALFSAEEMGLLGSKHLAEKLKNEQAGLYTVVNIEMIGVPFQDRDYTAFVTGYDLSNMAAKINEYTNSTLIGKSDVAVKYNLFKRSDNYPFYEQLNIPAQTVSSCDLTNFDFYHHVDDEADKMDYEHMADLINKLIPAVETMSNTATQEIKMNE